MFASKNQITSSSIPSNVVPFLFEHASVGCALVASDGRVVSVTRAFAEMLDCPINVLFGQSIFKMLTCSNTSKPRTLLEEGQTSTVTRSGRSLSWTVHKIARGAALTGYYVGLLCDEGQLKAFERKLVHRDRLAMIGESTAAIAHELAGPMNVIANNAELLLGQDGTVEDSRETLLIMRDEAFRLIELVRDILCLARDTPLNICAQDALKLVKKWVRLIGPQLPYKNIQLRIEAEPNLPPVAGDAQRLQQVFFNLITNACDASPSGREVLVQLRGAELEGGDPAVEITIVDGGDGIAASDLKQVFEPFFSTKPVGEGTGLGLAIAHRIVTAHRGELHLVSKPGEGARATVLLPVY
jgi:signal transduction histidine kinase